MKTILAIIALLLLLTSLTIYIFIRLKIKPRLRDIDDYYHEFEDQHPAFAAYQKWSRITFTCLALAVLLIFLAAYI